MNAKTMLASILLSLTATACDPDPFDATVECISDGSCWANSPSWTGWLAATTTENIDKAMDGGAIVPSPSLNDHKCWSIAGTDGHMCVVEVDGIMILGRPADELDLDLIGPECEFVSEWTDNGTYLGLCFAVFDGIAIQVVETI